MKRALIAAGVIGLFAIVGAFMLLRPDPAASPRIDPSRIDLSALDRVPSATWDRLAGKRVFFGHQSVGADIVAGLQAVMKAKPQIKLRITESSDPGAMDQPGLVHAKIGANESVDSKLQDFAAAVKGPMGERCDIAFMKFCYVDLFGGGDHGAILDKYKRTVSEIAAARPAVQLVHLTMPVTTVEAGAKARVKKALGKSLGGYAHNYARSQYNSGIRREFGSMVWDVAKSESSLPGGQTATFEMNGASHECLSTGYTDDGGHLNEAGKLAVARDLLLFLAERCK